MSDKKNFWVDSRQINVGNGCYRQTYYTDAVGVKVDNTPVKAPPIKINPNATYYFYVTPKAYEHIGELADELYGPTPPGFGTPWYLFANYNIQIYGINPIPAGAWIFIPKFKEKYEIGNVLKFMDIVKLSKAEQEKLDETGQNLYGDGVKLLGYMYFALEQAAEGVATGLGLMDDNFNAVKQATEDLASLGEQAKQATLMGSSATAGAVKAEIRAKTAELTEKIQTFLEKTGKPSETELQKIKADTTLEWQKNLLSLKELNLADAEIDGLNTIIVKGSKIAKYSSALGKILLALGAAETGMKIYEACKANPESPLCYQAAAEDGGQFAGNVGGGALGSKVASYALNYSSSEAADGVVDAVVMGGRASVSEFLGCNLVLDGETVGTGFFVCTATIWAASGVGGYYGGELSSEFSVKMYEKAFQLMHGQPE